MQILCNHCGTTIGISDYQHQVTCPSCNTHLQIEEEKDRITATIIEERDWDNSIFEQKHLPSDLQNFSDLFDLMRLEAEYDEAMEDNFALSLIAGERLRPMLLRGLYRAVFGSLFTLWSMYFFGDLSNGIGFPIIGLFLLFYGLFLGSVGIRETIKWFRLWKFEKEYAKNKVVIMERLHFSIRELPNILKRTFADFEDNEKHGIALKKEFFYVEIFKKLRIYIGSPSVSKALRMFAIFIPTGFLGLFYAVEENSLGFVYVIFAIIMTFFGFFIMSDASTYQHEQEKYWEKRKKNLDEFRNYF
jgi:hypothetical protein